jgi:hypothetical protein
MYIQGLSLSLSLSLCERAYPSMRVGVQRYVCATHLFKKAQLSDTASMAFDGFLKQRKEARLVQVSQKSVS